TTTSSRPAAPRGTSSPTTQRPSLPSPHALGRRSVEWAVGMMDPAAIGPTPYPFRGEGDAMVEAPRYADGKVWINRTQYFADVPGVSWTFFIGGYQPAQKWLKDRKGRALSFDDVKHYQKIIRILAETDRIMQTITLTPGASDKVKARSPVPDP
ncbi:MAG: hypothetical protein IOC85_16220, partial [Rhodobacter sp.]|nr:hypothetical protein [Rhodobacter sp.]